MGTWDVGSFDNDAALDFVTQVDKIDDVAAALEPAGDLNSDAAAKLIAACEMLAALIGRPDPAMPEDAVAGMPLPDASLLARARKAIGQVRQGSELAELWAEEDDGAWQAALDDLLIRLDPDADYAPPARAEPQGQIWAQCYICNGSVPEAEVVDLIHEAEEDGIVWSTMTLHAHRACVEQTFAPPHWADDGKPHANVLAQFGAQLMKELDD